MSISLVEFAWRAGIKMGPLMTAVVVDAYEAGHGRLDVKLWGAIRVAHDEGPAVDRGEAQRYLAELPWNASAFLDNESLRFDEGPEGSVRVWAGDPATYVDLHFDEEGDIVRTYTETREHGHEGCVPWEGNFSAYETFGSLRMPTHGEVSWQRPTGSFTYWRGDIVSLDWE
ncbi:MAG: hypothetical protein GW913_02985 [Myxococcales bacterium]|nr:hypothetical protein [Myxococcales bacterium]